MRWAKAKTNFVVDAVIALAFLGELVSGIVLWWVLPSGGYQGGRGLNTLRVFIVEREGWRNLHDWLAITMVAGILLHLVLHWNWIACMVRNMWRQAFPPKNELVPVEQECEI